MIGAVLATSLWLAAQEPREAPSAQSWFPVRPVHTQNTVDGVLIPMLPAIGGFADLISTEVALKRGFVETNQLPFQQSTWGRVGSKVVYCGAQAVALRWLAKRGVRRRTRVLVASVGFLAGAIPAGINVCRMRGGC
ncbi:MAG: hypothetical protein QG615_1758 [Nitrospirota bacterium]|nr:hypothetical protein [Nitrospirota bacterium]